jgi:hypothetical protein
LLGAKRVHRMHSVRWPAGRAAGALPLLELRLSEVTMGDDDEPDFTPPPWPPHPCSIEASGCWAAACRLPQPAVIASTMMGVHSMLWGGVRPRGGALLCPPCPARALRTLPKALGRGALTQNLALTIKQALTPTLPKALAST